MSREAMFEGLAQVSGVVQCSRSCVCSTLLRQHTWEEDDGTVHTIEGGEQGDALMPLLFCLGQHAALEAIQREMKPNEKLFAFLDDLCLVSKPDRVSVFT